MSEGLLTRIGKWIDRTWEDKATESQLRESFNTLENHAISDKVELKDLIVGLSAKLDADVIAIERRVKDLPALVRAHGDAINHLSLATDPSKDLAELKTRMEKIELYVGITRKVDPTKPAVAKSAFQM